jgi:hypothetical protein
LRILNLLEAHHRQLAKVIASTSTSSRPSSAVPQTSTSSKQQQQQQQQHPNDPAAAPVSPPVVRRPPRRELSSSIASNLATARGKPASQRRALPAAPEVTTHHVSGNSSRLPPDVVQTAPDGVPRAATNTESFNSFFTSFESLFSKLSAPLAFAGLPLTIEEEPHPVNPQDRKPRIDAKERSLQLRALSRVTASPDLATLISPAALRAIREDAGPAFGTHESFYVVPPSGGTLSYAGIVSRDNAGSNEGILDDEDEFVDARESIGPPSPRSVRGGSLIKSKKPAAAVPKSEGGKTMEELELENTALRQLLDTQSKRLQMWEASSQSQSLALAQSLRLARPRDLPAPIAVGENEESEKLKELEELLIAERSRSESLDHRIDKLTRENEKLLGVLGKYRDKWELLKESARQRERQKAATAAATAASNDGGS